MTDKKRKALILLLAFPTIIGLFLTASLSPYYPPLAKHFHDTWVYEGEVSTTNFTSLYMDALIKEAKEIEITPMPPEFECVAFHIEFPIGTEFPYGELRAGGFKTTPTMITAVIAAGSILFTLVIVRYTWPHKEEGAPTERKKGRTK